MSEFRFPPGVTHIPQIDFSVVFNQNGGVTGTQSYLAKKSEIKKGSLLANTFSQGNILWNIDPNCPVPYRTFRLVSFTASDYAPGIVSIACDYSGAEFASGDGSSGEPAGLTTYTLRGTVEERPLSLHRKWAPLSDTEKQFLGFLVTGELMLGGNDNDEPGSYVEREFSSPPPGVLDPFPDATYQEWTQALDKNKEGFYFTGEALEFARLIAGGVQTFKAPAWSYSVRQEGTTGMTTGQLNALGKYANPPGNPPKPTSGYTWMLVGPDQEQVGDARFIKDFNFQLIEKNDAHDFLYQ